MRAMILERADTPLRLVEMAEPAPARVLLVHLTDSRADAVWILGAACHAAVGGGAGSHGRAGYSTLIARNIPSSTCIRPEM